MNPIRKHYLPTSRGAIHAQECGSGERVLVLLSITSFGGVLLDRVLPELAARGWRAVGLDLMGYGRSDKRDAVWLVEDFADNIQEALGVGGIAPAGLVCGHFSSWVGIEIAGRHVSGLAGLLLDGTPYFSPERRAAGRAAPPGAPKTWHPDGRHAVDYWKTAFGLLQRLDPDFVLPDVPDARLRARYLALLEATMFEPGTMEAANRFDIDAALQRLDLPVHLMCSDTDWNLPHHATLKAALPHASERRLDGVHPLHDLRDVDRAVEYVECVDGFFRRIPPPAVTT